MTFSSPSTLSINLYPVSDMRAVKIYMFGILHVTFVVKILSTSIDSYKSQVFSARK